VQVGLKPTADAVTANRGVTAEPLCV